MQITEASIRNQALQNLKAIERQAGLTERLRADPRKEQRLEAQECVWCYYTKWHALAGQAVTRRKCAVCSKEMTFSSTRTDKLCKECAAELAVCVHCGGPIMLNFADLTVHDQKAIVANYKRMLKRSRMIEEALKAAYLKHHVGVDDVGWDELGDQLETALCELLGDDGFVRWLEVEQGQIAE